VVDEKTANNFRGLLCRTLYVCDTVPRRDRNDLKLGTVVVVDNLSQPIDCWFRTATVY